MGWDDYVTTLTASEHVAKAGIYGNEGSPWAASPQLEPNVSEMAKMIKGFSDPGPLHASGVYIGGVKYIFLRMNEDGNALYFKKATTGGVLAKAGTCCVLGIYTEGMQPGECNKQVEKIAGYLKDNGY